jgi:hypothetical protein
MNKVAARILVRVRTHARASPVVWFFGNVAKRVAEALCRRVISVRAGI